MCLFLDVGLVIGVLYWNLIRSVISFSCDLGKR